VQQFRNATSTNPTELIGKLGAAIRGDGSLSEICKSLEKLDSQRAEKPVVVYHALWNVMVDCAEWLKKKGQPAGAVGQSNRVTEVQTLHRDEKAAFDEIKFKSDAFEANKAATGKPASHPLSGKFQFERDAFLADDRKSDPPAASVLLKIPKVKTVQDYLKIGA